MLKLSFTAIDVGHRGLEFGSDRYYIFKREYEALVESETARLTRFAKDEAPKKTGLFAEGIRGEVSPTTRGDYIGRIQSFGDHAFVGKWRLADLIIKGTKPHIIPKGGSATQMAKGYPLRFYWENGPKGPGIYHYWSVNHPGTKPNPFPARAVKRWKPWATRRLKQFGHRVAFVEHTTGASSE